MTAGPKFDGFQAGGSPPLVFLEGGLKIIE
jgi:hypothetical protein